nr:very-long-chain (3R)-3-hydroxyacyl-CoA dehydratase 2 [Ipomoea batatas]
MCWWRLKCWGSSKAFVSFATLEDSQEARLVPHHSHALYTTHQSYPDSLKLGTPYNRSKEQMPANLQSFYLLLYNSLQAFGCFISTGSITGAYASAGQLIWIVPSGVLLPLMQWGGRTHFLLAIVRSITEVQELPSVFITFSAWSISEVIRYSHYALNCISTPPHLVTYLRYTAFIVLYPIGVGPGEMWLMYQALPIIKERNLYADRLPFSYYNFVVDPAHNDTETKSLVICGRELFVSALANEDDLVDQGGDGGTEERAEPVNPVALPAPAHHGRPEGHRGVHRCTVECPAGKNIGTHYETNGDRGNDPNVALLRVNRGGVHRVNQPEAKIAHQSTGGKLEKQASNDRAEQLGNPINNTSEEGDVTSDEGAKCDSRVYVTAGNIGADGNRHEECKSVGYCRRNESGGGGGSIIRQLISMPEPEPAKTNISMEMNSATAALRASGEVASPTLPIAILGTAISTNLQNFLKL